MGGGGHGLPAADRRCSSELGAADAGPDAGAGRPAGDAAGPAGDRSWRFLRDLRARGARRRRARARAHGRARAGAPRCAARRATTSGAAARRAARPRPGAARSRGSADAAVELWTSSATHAVLPLLASDAGRAAAAGHRHRVARAPLRRLRRRLVAAGVRLRARAGARPGRARACARSAWTRPRRTASARPSSSSRCSPRRAWWPCRSTGRPWSWSGTTGAATRRTRPTATTTAAPPTTCARGATGRRRLRPGSRRRPGAREHARDFVRRASQRLDAYAGRAAGPGCSAARWTPSCSGHWWYEGQAWLRGRGRGGARAGAGAGHGERGRRARRAGASGAARVQLGHRQGPVHLGLAAGGRAGVRRPPRRAANRGAAARGPEPTAALARAARELLALQASDWAFQVTRELAADYPLRRVAGHAAAHDAALGALADSAPVPDPALRNLAPDLDLAALVAP